MSKDELERCWSAAIRGAARAVFPKQSAALGHAAYLGGVLTVAGRISEERVHEHLDRAAKVAGVRPEEAERVTQRSFHLGRAHALGEVARGGAVEGHPPGAFRAVAAASDMYHHELEMFVDPGALTPLPVATLVYLNHEFEPDPVAVAVPRMSGGLIEVDAVFSSAAGAAWTLTRTGRLPAVSIYARCLEFHRGASGRLVKGVLTSVDLCDVGKDERAKVTSVVPAAKMTPAQREVQRRFDQYLADASPVAFDFFDRVERQGAGALEPLRPVVAPLVGGWSEPPPQRRASSQMLTRSATQQRCEATRDGIRCQHPAGHAELYHFADTTGMSMPRGTITMAWDDRACGHTRSAIPVR